MGAKARRKRVYGLAEAKAKLSEVVARAQTEGPQQIHYRGRPAVYVVAAKEWEQRTQPQGSLLDWFKSTGLWGAGIELESPPDWPLRDIKL